MDSYKTGLADAKKSLEEAQKKVREVESLLSAKDKIINDLRLQVPASVDRALAMASVTGGSTLALSEDYETKRALNVAQQTVASLRDRLAQKEETLERYEKLLRQIRSVFRMAEMTIFCSIYPKISVFLIFWLRAF